MTAIALLLDTFRLDQKPTLAHIASTVRDQSPTSPPGLSGGSCPPSRGSQCWSRVKCRDSRGRHVYECSSTNHLLHAWTVCGRFFETEAVCHDCVGDDFVLTYPNISCQHLLPLRPPVSPLLPVSPFAPCDPVLAIAPASPSGQAGGQGP